MKGGHRVPIAAGILALLAPLALSAAQADQPAPEAHFTARNGASECWGKDGRSTLWHFIVFNDGTKQGRYRVEYRREPDGELRTYSERVPKGQGINDGLVIRPGKTIDYVRVEALNGQGTLFLRFQVPGLAKCSS